MVVKFLFVQYARNIRVSYFVLCHQYKQQKFILINAVNEEIHHYSSITFEYILLFFYVVVHGYAVIHGVLFLTFSHNSTVNFIY